MNIHLLDEYYLMEKKKREREKNGMVLPTPFTKYRNGKSVEEFGLTPHTLSV